MSDIRFLTGNVNRYIQSVINDFTIPSPGSGFYSSDLTNAINNILSNLIEPNGMDLQNTTEGSNLIPGLVTDGLFRKTELIKNMTKKIVMNIDTKEEIGLIFSKKNYVSGLNDITGIEIDFVSQGCLVDTINNRLEYISSTKEIRFSSNAGANFGPNYNIDLPENSVLKVENATGDRFLFLRRTSESLSSVDEIESLGIDDTYYSVGFMGNINPFYLEDLSTTYDLVLPIVTHLSNVTPELQAAMLKSGFIDLGSTIFKFEQTFTAADLNVDGNLIVTHNRDTMYGFVKIYNDLNEKIITKDRAINLNNIELELYSFNITGTWKVIIYF